MDIFEMYDQYQQGKYIKDINQEKMDLLEFLHTLDEKQRVRLMRISVRLQRRRMLLFTFALLLYTIVGFGAGLLVAW